MKRAVIVAARRTAVGKIGGIFRDIPPEELAATVIRGILDEFPVRAEEIDEVILGNAVGPGGNLARLSALEAGLPVNVPGVTVDRQCGSGLEAIIMAARLIQAGAGDIYLAGGVESTSLAPWKLAKPINHFKGFPEVMPRARFSPDFIGDPDMGIAAENVAERYGITREDQDRFALESHRKAVLSQETGRFTKEIVPVRGICTDECPRPDTTAEKLAMLPPVFKSDGTVTAGNACPVNDGAAVVLMMSEEKCKELKLVPLAKFMDATSAGVDPNYLGIGPVPAVRKLLARTGLSTDDIDWIEFNEAFASQVLASLRELQIDEKKVNRGGGAIALGHPYGASGAILVTRLCTEMHCTQGKYGLATLGIAGGLGLAVLFEKVPV